MQAKGKRVKDKHTGVVRPRGTIQSRGFGQYVPNIKDINDDMETL